MITSNDTFLRSSKASPPLFSSSWRQRRQGKIPRAGRGLVAGGNLFGYRNVEQRDASGRRTGVDRVIEPAEVEVVLPAYVLYLAKSKKRDEWGELRSASVPQDDWVVREREDLRIIPATLWAQVQARMQGQREIYMRHSDGRLFSKPSNSLEAKYLLSNMALCGQCGGTFTAKRSGHRIAARRHVRHTCHNYLVKGSSVRANALTLPRAATERAVLSLIESTLLRPEVAEAALDRALAKLSAGPDAQRERARLAAALAKTEKAITNLVEAIAESTGPRESLLQAVATKEADQAALTRQLAQLDSQDALRAIDRAVLRRRVEATLRAEGWVGLLQAALPRARQILANSWWAASPSPRARAPRGATTRLRGAADWTRCFPEWLPLPLALVTPAGFEPAISTLKGSRPWPG